MEAAYQKVIRFEVTAECVQPMHIGSGDADGSVLARESDGVPFIQGTSIAGVFQSYIRQVKGDGVADELFGSWDDQQKRNRKSRMFFSEGSFLKETLHLEMRTRVSINGRTGSVNSAKMTGSDKTSGQVLDMEYVSAGSQFSFLIYLFDADAAIAKECLAAMNHGVLSLGGMNTIGCGKAKLIKVTERQYDMTDEKDRMAWQAMQPAAVSASGSGDAGTDVTDEICKMSAESPYYELTAEIGLRTPFLIRANDVDSNLVAELLKNKEQTVDAMPILNGQREFVIPGSSLKGVFRSRMETIASYLQVDDTRMKETFMEKSSCLFEDAVIMGTKKDGYANRQPRIHINKISGGVMDKALFAEMTIGGNAVLHINVEKSGRKEDALDAEAVLGLVLYSLRDFAIGAATIGSGSGIGRGYISVGRVTVADGGEVLAKLSMENPTQMEEKSSDFVAKCMGAIPGKVSNS